MPTKTVEMVVSLKVPDNTAITALQTLHKLGFEKVRQLKRADYCKFEVSGDLEKFKQKISKVDVIINANKHSFGFELKDDGTRKVLVRNIDDDGRGLLELLQKRLGFSELKKVSKATLWSMEIDDKNANKIAENATKELLVNEHYQEYSIL